jgi:hypothetical protein
MKNRICFVLFLVCNFSIIGSDMGQLGNKKQQKSGNKNAHKVKEVKEIEEKMDAKTTQVRNRVRSFYAREETLYGAKERTVGKTRPALGEVFDPMDISD